MRKDKSGLRYRDSKGNNTFIPRKSGVFDIGPNSSPRKVSRWLARGGGSPLLRSPEKIAHDHIHPMVNRPGAYF